MPMADTTKVLPHANYAGSFYAGGGAAYCSHPAKSACGPTGVVLWVLGACVLGLDTTGVCLDPNAVGPLGAIDLVAAAPSSREGREAVTLRGIRLGDPVDTVLRVYKKARVATGTCGAIIPAFSGPTYVIVAGHDTLSIATFKGRVREITLIEGKHPNLCERS
jgi:hypothetical protein